MRQFDGICTLKVSGTVGNSRFTLGG